MFLILSILWFIRTSKHVLFWLYLWQLKEYHMGRFLDHFKTQKGQRLVLNPLQSFKILLTILFFLVIILFPIILYVFEQNVVQFTLYLLVFDILTPIIITAVVFLFQPLVILLRNNTIRKATNKLKNLKLVNDGLVVVGITGSYGKTSTKE